MRDAGTLVSGSWDRTIKVWDLTSGRAPRTLRGGAGGVASLALSADGRILASSQDKAIYVWELDGGQLLQTLQGHAAHVESLAIDGDGHTLFSGSWDGTIKVWDLQAGRELDTLPGHSAHIETLSLSADGHILVSGAWDGTIKLWDVTSRLEVGRLSGHKNRVEALALTADGRTLISGSSDATIKIWALASREELRILQGHTGAVKCLVLSAEEHTLVSGSEDNTIKLWDLESGCELCTLRGHAGSVYSLAMSTDGRTLVSGSEDKTIKVWEIDPRRQQSANVGWWYSPQPVSGRIAAQLKAIAPTSGAAVIVTQLLGGGYSIAHSSSGISIEAATLTAAVAATRSCIEDYSSKGKNMNLYLAGFPQRRGRSFTESLQLQLDPRDSDHVLYVISEPEWSTDPVELSRMFGATYDDRAATVDHISDAVREPNGHRSITAWRKPLSSTQGNVPIVDLPALTAVSETYNARTVSPGGGPAPVRDTDRRSIAAWLKQQSDTPGRLPAADLLALTPDGSKLISSSSRDNTIKMWELPTGRPLGELGGHSGHVESLMVSGNGRILASGSWDGTIKLWDLVEELEPRTLTGAGFVTSLAMSYDGDVLVCGGEDDTIRCWDLKKWWSSANSAASLQSDVLDIFGSYC